MADLLTILEINICNYQSYVDDIRIFHNSALEIGQPMLAIHAKRALEGLEAVIGFFERVHSAILKNEEPIKIPIVKKGRPKLTLIKGGKL